MKMHVLTELSFDATSISCLYFLESFKANWLFFRFTVKVDLHIALKLCSLLHKKFRLHCLVSSSTSLKSSWKSMISWKKYKMCKNFVVTVRVIESNMWTVFAEGMPEQIFTVMQHNNNGTFLNITHTTVYWTQHSKNLDKYNSLTTGV